MGPHTSTVGAYWECAYTLTTPFRARYTVFTASDEEFKSPRYGKVCISPEFDRRTIALDNRTSELSDGGFQHAKLLRSSRKHRSSGHHAPRCTRYDHP